MDLADEVLGRRPSEFAKVFGQKKLMVPPGQPGDDRSYLEFKDKGISIVLESDIATCVHLYSEGRDGYSQYIGPLPGNVKFTSSRQEVRQALGPPTVVEEGAPVGGIANRRLYPFDSWLAQDRRITIEYNEHKSAIRLVSIMGPEEL